MKITLTTNQIADRLFADESANWSRNGAKALAEYLERLEEDLGVEFDLDIVAFRCEYSEYGSLGEWCVEYGADIELGDDDAIRDYIEDRGMLIEFDGGVIVSEF